ncbi:MAG: DUF4252 domain-containing protein [bacterium]|jgi:hypothetical protein|nr:DUF4252 domain-containing protein [candidate division KSB1 bacterium]MDH7560439.1 DUF4252 domain-containing protein [bacterium]
MSIVRRGLLLLVAAIAVAGCADVDRNFRHVRDTVLRASGAKEVKTVFQLSLGPGSMWLTGAVANVAAHGDEAAALLLDIRSVQVGLYQLRECGEQAGMIPKSVERSLTRRGYEPIVKVKGRKEATMVLAHLRKERIDALFVIAADGEELVLVEVRGRLERVLEEAVRSRGLAAKGVASRVGASAAL